MRASIDVPRARSRLADARFVRAITVDALDSRDWQPTHPTLRRQAARIGHEDRSGFDQSLAELRL
jgi:hypothetical protein